MPWKIELINENKIVLVTMNSNSVNCLSTKSLNDLINCIDTINNPNNSHLYGKYKPIILRSDPSSKAFSAGMDIKYVLNAKTKLQQKQSLNDFEYAFEKLLTVNRQTIACIENHSIGGGFILALLCDLRIGCNGNYKLGVNEIHFGKAFPSIAYSLIKYKMNKSHKWKLLLQGKLYNPKDMFEQFHFFDYFIDKKEEVLDKCISEALSIPDNSRVAYLSVKKYLVNEILKEHRQMQEEISNEFVRVRYSKQSRTKLKELVKQLTQKKYSKL